MECAVITTYRCNARCQMCNTWQFPTRKGEEFDPAILNKIPAGMTRLNVTGGEPTLREDILDIIRILDTKTKRLELSTNGSFPDRLAKIGQSFPNITVRVSVEGLPRLNDEVRGIKNGFDHALRSILRLRQLGVRDIGFGVVMTDHNCQDLLDVYHLCAEMDLELGNCAMHNSFYFHKFDNRVEDLDKLTTEMRRFIRALLTSRRANLRLRIKDWGRAYINLGLLRYMQGQPRTLPCGAGRDLFFVSPGGEIYACNGSDEPWIMGDLRTQSFEEIWHSEQADRVRERVAACDKNCWMTGNAVPAMRKAIWVPLLWVLKNKLRIMFGKEVVYS